MRRRLSPNDVARVLAESSDAGLRGSGTIERFLERSHGFTWHLHDVSVRVLASQLEELQGVVPMNNNRAVEYAAKNTEAPPVLVSTIGSILDGRHRVQAAAYRGNRMIRAYLPKRRGHYMPFLDYDRDAWMCLVCGEYFESQEEGEHHRCEGKRG